jgi:hypothetical protein
MDEAGAVNACLHVLRALFEQGRNYLFQQPDPGCPGAVGVAGMGVSLDMLHELLPLLLWSLRISVAVGAVGERDTGHSGELEATRQLLSVRVLVGLVGCAAELGALCTAAIDAQVEREKDKEARGRDCEGGLRVATSAALGQPVDPVATLQSLGEVLFAALYALVPSSQILYLPSQPNRDPGHGDVPDASLPALDKEAAAALELLLSCLPQYLALWQLVAQHTELVHQSRPRTLADPIQSLRVAFARAAFQACVSLMRLLPALASLAQATLMTILTQANFQGSTLAQPGHLSSMPDVDPHPLQTNVIRLSEICVGMIDATPIQNLLAPEWAARLSALVHVLLAATRQVEHDLSRTGARPRSLERAGASLVNWACVAVVTRLLQHSHPALVQLAADKLVATLLVCEGTEAAGGWVVFHLSHYLRHLLVPLAAPVNAQLGASVMLCVRAFFSLVSDEKVRANLLQATLPLLVSRVPHEPSAITHVTALTALMPVEFKTQMSALDPQLKVFLQQAVLAQQQQAAAAAKQLVEFLFL